MSSQRHDLKIVQRTTFKSPLFAYREADETTVKPLTGATVKAQLRSQAGSPTLLAEFAVTLNGPNGTVQLGLTAVQTAALPISKAEYDVLVTLGGETFLLVEGEVKIDGTVTVT